MRQKDLLLISHLRNNARTPMTKISKKTSIPVSTIFDKLKDYEGNVINKHTCLLNFKALGYDVKAHLLFKISKEEREGFQTFLATHNNINNIFRINNGYDFLVEGIFTNLQDLNNFYEQTERFPITDRKEYFVLSDIKREAFLNYEPGFDIIRKNHG